MQDLAPRGAAFPRSKMNRDVHETSGFSIVVSEQADLRAQVRDATRFLGDHRDELLTLGRQPAIEGMVLDFGCFVSVEHFARFLLAARLRSSHAPLSLDRL